MVEQSGGIQPRADRRFGDLAVQRVGEVVVSGQGVREGLALSLARDRLDPAPAVRRRAVLALASRFAGWSRDRAERRSATALLLLQGLDSRPSPEIAEALGHAATLLDTGRTIARRAWPCKSTFSLSFSSSRIMVARLLLVVLQQV